MPRKHLLVTGFGPFPGVERNPSREIAMALEQQGIGDEVEVSGAELPVVFAEVAPAIDAVLRAVNPPPDVILGLGVWGNGDSFRLERRARGVFDTTRVDNAGLTGAGLDLGPARSSDFDLAPLAECMRQAGAGEVRLSDDAGGYVCERTYLHLLTRAQELHARALFLHVPPLGVVPLERQIACVKALARELVRARPA
jgi:pyroglutamyl-peptidase